MTPYIKHYHQYGNLFEGIVIKKSFEIFTFWFYFRALHIYVVQSFVCTVLFRIVIGYICLPKPMKIEVHEQ